MKVRTTCIGKDIVVEWVGSNTVKPIEVLPLTIDSVALFHCREKLEELFFPGQDRRVIFAPESPRLRILSEEVFLEETFDVSYNIEADTLTLHRGGLELVGLPEELPQNWVVAEEFALRSNQSEQ